MQGGLVNSKFLRSQNLTDISWRFKWFGEGTYHSRYGQNYGAVVSAVPFVNKYFGDERLDTVLLCDPGTDDAHAICLMLAKKKSF